MEYKYKAFISYRHAERDSAAAKAVHTAVERYVIPKKLRRDGKKRPGKVFRDEEELRASSDLSADICEALDQSEYLIVICSPDALESEWVPKEIAYFREHRDQKNILTVLTGGIPGEIFPALMPGMPEPLFLDLTQSSDDSLVRDLKDRFLKLCARLLDCEYDDLVRRDEKRRRRQLIAWMSGITAVAAVIIGILLWSNWQIRGRNREILLRESEILTREAVEALDEGDRYNAIANAVAALPTPEQDRPYYAPAEQALWSALDLFGDRDNNYVFRETVMEQGTAVVDLCVSDDGKLLITMNDYGTITGFDTVTGQQLWSRELQEGTSPVRTQMFMGSRQEHVLCCVDDWIISVCTRTGEVLWSRDDLPFVNAGTLYHPQYDVLSVSCLDAPSNAYTLTQLSGEDGSIVCEIPLTGKGINSGDADLSNNTYLVAVQGAEYALGCYFTSETDGTSTVHYYLLDPGEWTVTDLMSRKIASVLEAIYFLDLCLVDGELAMIVVHCNLSSMNGITVECIRLDDETLLWKQELTGTIFSDVVCVLSDRLLVAVDSSLNVMDITDGELMEPIVMDYVILDLTEREDGTFTYLLRDGSSYVMWFDSDRVKVTSELEVEGAFCDFGKIWNGGSIQVAPDDGLIVDFRMTDEDSGGGYVITVPIEDPCRVLIRRPAYIQDELTEKVWTMDPVHHEFDIQACGDDHLIVYNCCEFAGDSYECIVLDADTLTPKAWHHQPDHFNEMLFYPDASGGINTNIQKILRYDAEVKSYTVLADHHSPLALLSGAEQVWATVHQTKSIRLTDGNILSVAYTEYGLRLWHNGDHLRDVPYPQNRQLDVSFSGYPICLGANGYVIVSGASDSGDLELFAYDTAGDSWYRIPTELPAVEDSVLLATGETPVVLVLDHEGVIHVYDIPTGTQLRSFPTEEHAGSVWRVLFCREDRFVILRSSDLFVKIYDTVTGELLLRLSIDSTLGNELGCDDDPAGEKLFLYSKDISGNGRSGICISTDGWNVLAEIPSYVDYRKETGMLVHHVSYLRMGMNELVLTRFPTTEELVALGREFLGK